MTRTAEVAQLLLPSCWLGMVLAISFMEAPIKFRAPGITTALGLGIGRLVFRALNRAELVLASLVVLAVLSHRPAVAAMALVAVPVLVVLVQILGLRPALDRRAQLILSGQPLGPSHLHLVYIGLEVLKVAGLTAAAIVVATKATA